MGNPLEVRARWVLQHTHPMANADIGGMSALMPRCFGKKRNVNACGVTPKWKWKGKSTMEPIKTIDAGNGVTVKIYQDEDPDSPREWDNLGTMVCFHRDHTLGDEKHGFTPDTLQDKLKEPGLVWLSLYLYDHSGISISCGGPSLRKDNNHYPMDPGGWDTSLIGAIFVDAETIKEEMARPLRLRKGQINPDLAPIKHITRRVRERVLACLRGEVETYNQYLTGDVYGYVIEDVVGKHLDGCWGYYGGIEYCESEAMSAAAGHVERVHDREYGYCLAAQ